MATWGKHRLERNTFQVTFVDRLNVGETISSVDSLAVSIVNEFGVWIDHAVEFTPTTIIVNSAVAVDVTLDEADAGEQMRGEYTILLKVITSTNRELIGADYTQGRHDTYPTVFVSVDGDTSAPAEYA